MRERELQFRVERLENDLKRDYASPTRSPRRDVNYSHHNQTVMDEGNLGMEMADSRGRVAISAIIPSGPADRAGARVGDLIVSVGPTHVVGLCASEIAFMLRGHDAITLEVESEHNGMLEPRHLLLTRTGYRGGAPRTGRSPQLLRQARHGVVTSVD